MEKVNLYVFLDVSNKLFILTSSSYNREASRFDIDFYYNQNGFTLYVNTDREINT